MTPRAFLLSAAAVLLLPAAASTGYQPPVLLPGDAWTATVRVYNDGPRTVTTSARARLRPHPFWGGPGGGGTRGPWTVLPAKTVEPGGTATTAVELVVPAGARGVLGVEFRSRGRAGWRLAPPVSLPLVDAPAPAEGRRIPFRIVAGGSAAHDPDPETGGTIEEVVGDAVAWDAICERLGILPPDSWGIPPEGGDPQPDHRRRPAHFAAAAPPDFGSETLLVLRSPEHSLHVDPRRLRVRSVRERGDGTLVCTWTWRYRRIRGPVFGLWESGDYLLVAVPGTGAPVVFERAP